MQYESGQLTFDHEKLTPHGIYSFLRGIDTSVREVRDAQYDQERNTTSRFSRMEEEVSQLRKDIADVKITVGVTEHQMTDLMTELKTLREEVQNMKSEGKANGAKLDTLQSKLGLYISLLGIGVSVLLVLFQVFLK